MTFHFHLNYVYSHCCPCIFIVAFAHKRIIYMQLQLLLELFWNLILTCTDNITTTSYQIKAAFLIYDRSQIPTTKKFLQVQQCQNSSKMLYFFQVSSLLPFSFYITFWGGFLIGLIMYSHFSQISLFCIRVCVCVLF